MEYLDGYSVNLNWFPKNSVIIIQGIKLRRLFKINPILMAENLKWNIGPSNTCKEYFNSVNV